MSAQHQHATVMSEPTQEPYVDHATSWHVRRETYAGLMAKPAPVPCWPARTTR